MIKLQGLNEKEYAEIKKAIKEELTFRVSVRRWKRQYAYGAIDIRPLKKDDYRFNKEQVDEILAFMERHNLRTNSEQYHKTVAHYDVIYASGLNFLFKEIA